MQRIDPFEFSEFSLEPVVNLEPVCNLRVEAKSLWSNLERGKFGTGVRVLNNTSVSRI